jgi:cytochrome c553
MSITRGGIPGLVGVVVDVAGDAEPSAVGDVAEASECVCRHLRSAIARSRASSSPGHPSQSLGEWVDGSRFDARGDACGNVGGTGAPHLNLHLHTLQRATMAATMPVAHPPTPQHFSCARAMLATWACLLMAAAVQAAEANASAPPGPRTVPNTIAQRTQACTACHGKEGRSTSAGYFPRIAGKPAGYLANQLLHFREGRRTNPLMGDLVQHLSDDYLREMAGYFAGLRLPYPPPQPVEAPAAVLARGEALVHQGDAARQLPACVACHGVALMGVVPAIPGLLGLPRDYLIGQLGAWQTGQRHAVAPDCMGTVAQRLSPEDVSAVANWLAAQTVPPDAHPAERLPAKLPLACGGGAQ